MKRFLCFVAFAMIVQTCQSSNPRDDSEGAGVDPKDTIKIDSVISEIKYATTIPVLDSGAWLSLLEGYKGLNQHICTSLDKFGFCIDDQIACTRDRTGLSVSDAQGLAKTWISINSKFAGIGDYGKFEIKRSVGLGSCDASDSLKRCTDWNLVFRNQIYDGLEVLDTEISMYIDATGPYRVGGNWYSTIHVPAVDSFSLNRAKQSLYGDSVKISCFSDYVIIISPNTIASGGRKVIVPRKYSDRLELRVAWEISIIDQYYIYVDSTTGRIIRKKQIIIC